MMRRREGIVCARQLQHVVIAATLMGLSSFASADASFSGTLISNPPCDVYGDNDPIQIDFGEVGITRIDGVNYAEPLNLTITCGSNLGNNVALVLKYIGVDATSFNTQALQTNRRGLGILLSHDGTVIPPIFPSESGSGLPITMSSNGQKSLSFMAVPVKDPDPDTGLLEGAFSAMASMEIQYP